MFLWDVTHKGRPGVSFSISWINLRRRNGAWTHSTSSGTGFELIVERKLGRRQLTDDGNVDITGRDLREKNPPARQHDPFDRPALLNV